MRKFILALSLLVGLTSLGCGAKSKFEPREFSEEEKAKIKAEDKAIEDDESHGSNSKPRAKKR